MDISETVKKILQEVIVPELGKIKDENNKILAVLELTNKRLDDMNTHLADQSRRIDETNKRIDELRSDLTGRIDETNKRIDEVRSELSKRIEDVHSDLVSRLDGNNARIDRFFFTAATKEQHEKVDKRLTHLEREMDNLKQRLAA